MSRRILQAYAIGVSVVLVALAAWLAWTVSRERRSERSWQAQLQLAEQARRNDLGKLRRETAELERLRQELAQARSVLAASVGADGNPFEDALGSWLHRIERLNAYLGQHPELGIPELRYLTATDWLDATKDANLSTEADYRKALANLRTDAKRIVGPRIGEALKGYLATHNGVLPASAEALAASLPEGVDPAILQRYEINPSGEMPGLRGDLRLVLVEAKPVDPVWDSTFSFADKGGVVIRAPYSAASGLVADAISRYQQHSGMPPTQPDQITPYLSQKVDPAQVAALFTALTTKPNLPPSGGGH